MPHQAGMNHATGFQKYFRVVPALTQELKIEAFRIRHEVYCSELSFEPVRHDGRETDEYDTHSLHCLLHSCDRNEFIGCSRLVFARPENPSHPFPFERICGSALDRTAVDADSIDRRRVAEASRLAVVKEFRRRKGDHATPLPLSDGDFGGESGMPRFPYMSVGLYLATIALARHNRVEKLFMLTEERLASHLTKLGFVMAIIGNAVEHRGKRVPSCLDIRATIDHMRPMIRPIFDVVADEIESAYSALGDETKASAAISSLTQPA